MFSSQVRDNSCHVQDIKFRAQSKDKTNVKYTWIVKPWAGFLPERRDSKQKQNSWICFLKHNKTQKASICQSSRTRDSLGEGDSSLHPASGFQARSAMRAPTTGWYRPGSELKPRGASPAVQWSGLHTFTSGIHHWSENRDAAQPQGVANTHAQKPRNEPRWAWGWIPFSSTPPASLRASCEAGTFLNLFLNFQEVLVRAPVAQSCPTLSNPVDRSPPGSSVHGISQARILEWVAIPFSRGIFPTQGPNLGLLHCRQVLYRLNHQGQASVQFSRSVVSDPLRPHEPQRARLPCPSPTPRVHPSPCPSSRWCHPTISSSVVPSPPALNLSQHHSLFQWVSSSHQVAKVLGLYLYRQSQFLCAERGNTSMSVCLLSYAWLFETPWTVSRQAPLLEH